MDGINKELFTTSDQARQSYPFIQATNYEPKLFTKKEVDKMEPGSFVQIGANYYSAPKIGMSPDSYDLLLPAESERLALQPDSFMFGSNESILFLVPDDVRFVILCQPKLFKLNKEDKKISPLVKGDKLAGTKNVTVSRLLLGMIKDDQLVLDGEGNPQIITLKLTSTKTSLLGRANEKTDQKTIYKLNQSVIEHYSAPKNSWTTHLVSVNIAAMPHVFVSASNESSVGVMFTIDNAKPLPAEAQTQMHRFVTSEEFKELAADPFRLNHKEEVAAEDVPPGGTEPSFEDIPF